MALYYVIMNYMMAVQFVSKSYCKTIATQSIDSLHVFSYPGII